MTLEEKKATLDGKTIKFGDKEYKLCYKLKAFMFWEQLMSKPFSVETLTDTYVLFYSFLLASNKPFDVTFEQFMDMLDENHSAVREFNEWFRQQTELQAQIANPEKSASKKKAHTQGK